MDSITGPEGTKVHMKAQVTLSNPDMVIDLPDTTGLYSWQDFFTLTASPIGNPPDIEFSFSSNELAATLRSTTKEPVAIRASTDCQGAGEPKYIFSEYVVAGNVEAPLGYVDIGASYGLALPPRRHLDYASVDLRANSGGQYLVELEMYLTWDTAHISFDMCTKGLDLANSWYYDCTRIGQPANEVKVSVINSIDSGVLGVSIHIATVDFQVITTETMVSEIRVYIQTFKRQTMLLGIPSGAIESWDYYGMVSGIGKQSLNAPLLICTMDAGICQDRNVHRGGGGDVCPCANDFYGSDFNAIRPPPVPPSPPLPPVGEPPALVAYSLLPCGRLQSIYLGPTVWTFNDAGLMDSITGAYGTQVQIKARVILSNPFMVIDLPDPTGEVQASQLITLSTSDGNPATIGFDDLNNAYVATLLGNSIEPVLIRASTYCQGEGEPKYVYAENMVAGNLEAEFAEVDIGARYGLALPPKRHLDTLSVDIRANTGNQYLTALQMFLTWDTTHLSSSRCAQGSAWNSGGWYCTFKNPANQAKLSVINIDSVVSGVAIHLATVDFQVVTTETVHSLIRAAIQVFVRVDPSVPYQELRNNYVGYSKASSSVSLNDPLLVCKKYPGFRPPYDNVCYDHQQHRGGFRVDDDVCPCADDF